MTKGERIELGRLLDKHRVKAVWYGERGAPGGLYKVWVMGDDRRIKEIKIYGRELE